MTTPKKRKNLQLKSFKKKTIKKKSFKKKTIKKKSFKKKTFRKRGYVGQGYMEKFGRKKYLKGKVGGIFTRKKKNDVVPTFTQTDDNVAMGEPIIQYSDIYPELNDKLISAKQSLTTAIDFFNRYYNPSWKPGNMSSYSNKQQRDPPTTSVYM